MTDDRSHELAMLRASLAELHSLDAHYRPMFELMLRTDRAETAKYYLAEIDARIAETEAQITLVAQHCSPSHMVH